MQLEFSPTEREQETERVRRDLAALAQSTEHGPALLAEANSLLDEIRDRGTCSDEKYLELAERIVAALAPVAADPVVGRAILSLTRLHAGVGELLARHRLHGDLARVVALDPDDVTEVNRVLVEDLFFHHHLWEAHRQRMAGGWDAFARYLKHQPRLWSDPGFYALRSIVRDAIGTAIRQDDRETLLLLQRELGADPGVAKALDKRLQELSPRGGDGAPM
jgi:hypothetical protein